MTMLALALLMAGCRGGDDAETPGPANTPTPALNATAPIVTPATPGAPAETPTPGESVSLPTATVAEIEATATPTGPAVSVPPAPIHLERVNLGLEQVGSGFDQPVFVTHAGDGSGRIFVLEKTGSIRLLDGTLYLDISDRVLFYDLLTEQHELGLLGLAFHPDFANNGWFFVHYINRNQDHVIARFTEGPDGVADPTSEMVLFVYPQPDYNFAGGMLTFGPDGDLYIGMGTGTPDDPSQIVAQQVDNLFGKILRIDVTEIEPYGVPSDNPFVGQEGARPEVWAYGLRNPWRFAFDRATNDLYIGGPGEFRQEWVHFVPGGNASGLNFGWPILEGNMCWEAAVLPCDTEGLEQPILTYPYAVDGNCVIIGGTVYRGPTYPVLDGVYFYGDYCSGRIWGAGRDTAGVWRTVELLDTDMLITSFGEDEAGEVYVCDGLSGAVYRLTGAER